MPTCSKLFSILISISFSVCGFMWRSLMHLDFNFVQGDKNGFICILCQNHLLKMMLLPFSVYTHTLDDFSSFVKDLVVIGMWVYYWVFDSIPLICLPVTLPMPCIFIRISLQYIFRSGILILLEILILMRIAFAILGFSYSR